MHRSTPPCTAPHQVLRTHFHDFMLDVHQQLRKMAGKLDPLLAVADKIAENTRVLAMDEFFVTDVADAMILNRLFGRLWDRGVVLVSTSNRAPDGLYEGGLQRPLFMPFIHRLKVECDVHDMASPVDYRRLASHQRGLYRVTEARNEELYEEFVELAQLCAPSAAVASGVRVPVAMGRSLPVPSSCGPVCMFGFADLCGRPVAAADYIALCDRFHTLALSGVPCFGAANRSEAYRFVTLIDVLYEHRVRLLVSAEAMPFELFENVLTQREARERPDAAKHPDVVVDDNLGFSKDRTISRLTEMQSVEYLLHHAKQHAKGNVLALEEALAKHRATAAAA
uniref:ATPase n=1 Tax=Chlamydomonas euryale TaxID=1486919 RepID=A0A7R9YUT9_9CHLO